VVRISGLHARVKDDRHVVGLVVIDTAASECLGHSVWNAPVGESAAAQLHELYVRAHELLERNGAEALISWTTDAGPGGAGRRAQLIEASRAEGTVMAAAGSVATVTQLCKAGSATVRAASSADGTSACVVELCQPISGLPSDDPVRRAAAAALAWAQRC
jgi:hypothetical protein